MFGLERIYVHKDWESTSKGLAQQGRSIRISKEAKAVNQQAAEWRGSSLQTATSSLLYRQTSQHMIAPYKAYCLVMEQLSSPEQFERYK